MSWERAGLKESWRPIGRWGGHIFFKTYSHAELKHLLGRVMATSCIRSLRNIFHVLFPFEI
jgi:hypothetical protein